MSLEISYFEDILKYCRLNVVCGGKGSGKTHLLLAFVKLFLQYNLFEEYIIVLPELDNEADNQYEFLKHQRNMTLYKHFDAEIFGSVKTLSKTKKTFFGMDDATNILFKEKHNDVLTQIASTTRHGKGVMVFLLCHALNNIILPQVRGLIDHIFIGVFRNVKFIKAFYAENTSLVLEYKDFEKQYKDNIVNNEDNHPFLYMNRKAQIDYNVCNWEVLEYYDTEIKENGKSKIAEVNTDKKLIKKYKEQIHNTELKESLKPKKTKFSPFLRKHL